MTGTRILIAGIGNIFLGDDGFGVEVAQQLARRPLPEGVRVVDFGIRGMDLVYALLDQPEVAILVDAVPRGGSPGTLYTLEVPPEESEASPADLIQPHSMDPVKVLRLARAMGGSAGRLLVVGCEPQPFAEVDEMEMGLSEPVRAVVGEAVALIETLVGQLLAELAAEPR